MRSVVQTILILTLLVLGHSIMSWACSCVPQTPCGVHRYADADFVGEVLSKRVMPSDEKPSFDRVLFEIRVIERLRGMENVGDVVSIRTGFGGGDCGYEFKIGAKYLIDASKSKGALYTGICSLTALLENSEVELRSLRRLAAGQRLPDLVGVLMRGTETADGEDLFPLSGVTIQAKGIGGGKTTATDAVGSFTFENLLNGRYELILGIPPNLSAAYTNFAMLKEDQEPSVPIESKDAGGAACHTLIVVKEGGSISGVVQSAGDGPVDGWVNADTVTRDDKPWNTVRDAVPLPDGKFILRNLKPGRYSVQFVRRAGFVRGKPQIIELRDGERRTGILLSP